MTAVIESPNGVAKNGKKPEAPTPPPEKMEIRPIESELIRVPVIGTSPLIVSKFSQKSRTQMLEAQQGVKKAKENRDPKAEYENAMYRFADGGYGIPTAAFKQATVSSARFYGKSVTMRELQQFLFFRGEFSDVEKLSLVRVLNPDGSDLGEGDGTQETDWPRMREDVVRLAGPSRSADLRFRPEFVTWRADLHVVFVKNRLDRSSVVSLIDAGGMGVGVGEWRPERRGEFGTYTVDHDAVFEVETDA